MKTNTIKDIVQQSNRKDTKMKKYERALAKLISTYNLDPCQNVTRGSAHGNRGIPFDLRSRMYHWIVEIAGRGHIFADATTIVEPQKFDTLVAFILHNDASLDFYFFSHESDMYEFIPTNADSSKFYPEGVNVIHGSITDEEIEFLVNETLYNDGLSSLMYGCGVSYILSVEKEKGHFCSVSAEEMRKYL